jgi:hypothetical protein
MRRIEGAVKHTITFCEQSGNKSGYHFADAGKKIEVGKTGTPIYLQQVKGGLLCLKYLAFSAL